MVAVQVQPGPVVPAAVDLDPVVLDGAPRHVEELVRQLRTGRQSQRPGPGQADLKHLRRENCSPGHCGTHSPESNGCQPATSRVSTRRAK